MAFNEAVHFTQGGGVLRNDEPVGGKDCFSRFDTFLFKFVYCLFPGYFQPVYAESDGRRLIVCPAEGNRSFPAEALKPAFYHPFGMGMKDGNMLQGIFFLPGTNEFILFAEVISKEGVNKRLASGME